MKIAAAMLAFMLALGMGAANAGMYRANGKVIGPNDPVSKVLDNMGRPEWTEAVTNKYGVQLGAAEAAHMVKRMLNQNTEAAFNSGKAVNKSFVKDAGDNVHSDHADWANAGFIVP